MTATLYDFDPTRARMAETRTVSRHLIQAAVTFNPTTETAIAGFVQAAFDVAMASSVPGMARQTAALFRSMASLIEETNVIDLTAGAAPL